MKKDNNILPQMPEQKKSLKKMKKYNPKKKKILVTEKIETIKENKIKPKLKPKDSRGS